MVTRQYNPRLPGQQSMILRSGHAMFLSTHCASTASRTCASERSIRVQHPYLLAWPCHGGASRIPRERPGACRHMPMRGETRPPTFCFYPAHRSNAITTSTGRAGPVLTCVTIQRVREQIRRRPVGRSLWEAYRADSSRSSLYPLHLDGNGGVPRCRGKLLPA